MEFILLPKTPSFGNNQARVLDILLKARGMIQVAVMLAFLPATSSSLQVMEVNRREGQSA